MHLSLTVLANEVFTLMPVLVVVFTAHGFSSAAAAWILGDKSPEIRRHMSFNPLVHVELIGIVIVAILLPILQALVGGAGVGRVFLSSMVWTILILSFYWYHFPPVSAEKLSGRSAAFLYPCVKFLIMVLFAAGIAILRRVVVRVATARFILAPALYLTDLAVSIILFFATLASMPIPPFEGGKIVHKATTGPIRVLYDFMDEYWIIVMAILFLTPIIGDAFIGFISYFVMFIKSALYTLVGTI